MRELGIYQIVMFIDLPEQSPDCIRVVLSVIIHKYGIVPADITDACCLGGSLPVITLQIDACNAGILRTQFPDHGKSLIRGTIIH